MKQKICFLIIGALAFSQLGATKIVEAENSCLSKIFISEIGWSGSTKSAADEWLELANGGEIEIDLSNWVIEGAGTSGSNLVLPEMAKISPRSVYLIANYGSENTSSNLATPPNYVTTAVSLSNSSLRLNLKDSSDCLIDTAGNGQAPFFGGTGTAGAVSMARLEPLNNGELSEAWTAAETSKNFDTATDFGTPGSIEWPSLFSSASEDSLLSETIPEEAVTEVIETTEETAEITFEEIAVDETKENLQTETETVEAAELLDFETPLPSIDSGTAEYIEEFEVEEIIAEQKIIVEEISKIMATYTAGTLLINEFVPDPVSGEKEWVEVINPNNKTISLDDWKISESSGRSVSLPNLELGYGQVAIAEFSSSALNNDSDIIQIIAPDGTVVDEVAYGSTLLPTAADPNSVARDGEGTFTTSETPTKGKMNVITKTITVIETVETCSKSSLSTKKETTTSASATISKTTEKTEKQIPPTVRLSEIYPNTDGSDETAEFIELENYGSETINLFGLVLKDAAGNSWTVPDHRELKPEKFLALNRTEYKFALNNSGQETVILYSTDGSPLDQIQYEDAPKNSTYAKADDIWNWTAIITPNEPNSFPPPVETKDNSLAGQTDHNLILARADAPEPLASISIAEARGLGKDDGVRIEGIVSVAPGVLGKQIFYVTDNLSGIQVYKSDGNFPELFVGDLVEINGAISSNRGEPRIKIGQDDEIVVLASEMDLEVNETTTIGRAEAGEVIKIAGIVTEKSSNKFTVETATDLIEAKIKDGTKISLVNLKPGDQITVKGLVGQSEENFFLLPRSPDDLIIKTPDIVPVTATIEVKPTGKQLATETKQNNALGIGAAAIFGLIIYTVTKYRGAKNKSYEKTSKLSFAPTG